ncbi:MAG: HAMP domain-containing histidine kinase [Phycisphaerae bacterium]|nr:HAMP domain-containing histidine kinase [Phycisphaerae bacterium]
MQGLLEKRQSLNHQVKKQQKINETLASRIRHLQPLANLGLVSAMIAHEMNNILTPLGSYAELSMSHPEDIDLARKTIKKTAINSERAAKILHSMLTMARGQQQDKKGHNVKSLVDEVFTLIARDFSKDRIKLTINVPEDLTVYAESICLQQVLMNLVINARDAIVSSKTTSGVLEISAYSQDGSVIIEVSDNGCGVEAADMEKIFDAFYSTKSENQKPGESGAGLGLAFCKKVIDDHDGSISAISNGETGTTFKITLPEKK